MMSRGPKDKILRFVLESSPEENQKLASFMAGIRAQGQDFGQGKAGEGKAVGARALVVDNRLDARGMK
jgi:hypothetical protein